MRRVCLSSLSKMAFSKSKVNMFRHERAIVNPETKDLTKVPQMKDLKATAKERIVKPYTTTDTVSLLREDNIKKIKLAPKLSFPKKPLNSRIKKVLNKKVDVEDLHNRDKMEDSLFSLDYTAQSLENQRKTMEESLFNKRTYEVAKKKAAMRLASLRDENLIDDYHSRFANYRLGDNTSGEPRPSYATIDFLEAAQSPIGSSLEEENPMFLPKNAVKKTVSVFKTYENNQKQLENLRMERFLEEPKPSNLLGNSDSALELQPNLSKSNTDLNKQLSLLKQNEEIENKELDRFHERDLHFSHGKVSFKELTVEQNKIYLKHSIKDANELFRMFREIQKVPEQSPVLAAMVQKLAVLPFAGKYPLLRSSNFEALFRQTKKILPSLDNKNLVDTLWATGHLFKTYSTKKSDLIQSFTDKGLKLVQPRVSQLTNNELLFLAESTAFLDKYNHKTTKLLVEEFSTRTFDSVFQLGKLASFLYYSNSPSTDRLTEMLISQLTVLFDTRTPENFNELDPKTTSSLLNAVSWALAKQKYIEYYQQQPQNLVKSSETTDLVLGLLERHVILHIKQYSVKQISQILFSLSTAGRFHSELWQRSLSELSDSVEVESQVKMKDLSKAAWAISQFYKREGKNTLFNEVSAVIMPNLTEIDSNLKFSIFKKFAEKTFKGRKMFDPQAAASFCFSLSSSGFNDISFFLPVIHNFMFVKDRLDLEGVCYNLHTLSMLNYRDSTIIKFFLKEALGKIGVFDNFNRDYCLSQLLASVVMLDVGDYLKAIDGDRRFLLGLMQFVDTVYDCNQVHYIAISLWFCAYSGVKDENFYRRNTEKIKKSLKSLTFYDRVILDQTMEYLSIVMDIELGIRFNEESTEFERLRLKELEKYENLSTRSFKAKDEINKLVSSQKLKFDFSQEEVQFEPLIEGVRPTVYLKSKKTMFFLLYHAEMVADNRTNGFLLMRHRILAKKGFTVKIATERQIETIKRLNYGSEQAYTAEINKLM